MVPVSALAVDASVETAVESSREQRVNAAAFRLCVLGPLAVTAGGEPLALPKSKKTRALLAYLALAGGPVRRERLCEMFWDAPDDPRGSLRWSLSKLRPIANTGKIERLWSDADAVAWRGAPADLDLRAVEQMLETGAGGLQRGKLAALAKMFRGELGEGLDLPEHDAYQRWLVAERERVRALRGGLLCALIDRLDASPADALPHAGVLAELAPYDEAAHARLFTLHRRLGREKEARQAYDAGLRALREAGRPTAALDAAWRGGAPRKAEAEPPPVSSAGTAPKSGASALTQDIRFCRAAGGVRIAYATVGSGPPLVKTSNWMNHLEYDWESPVWRHLLHACAENNTFIRYDSRGNGLSDWAVEDFSFETRVADLEAVIEAAGVERFALLGMSQGCSAAIEYAVRHPQRVTKLVLYGGFARGWAVDASPRAIEEGEATVTLMRTGWGRDNPAFRQMFASLFFPEGTPEQFAAFNELQRMTTSGENAAKLMLALGQTDVTHRLAQVTTPTLVIHARGDAAIRYQRGLEIAAGIPGARFVTLESRNHVLLEHEPAWPKFWNEVSRFLAED